MEAKIYQCHTASNMFLFLNFPLSVHLNFNKFSLSLFCHLLALLFSPRTYEQNCLTKYNSSVEQHVIQWNICKNVFYKKQSKWMIKRAVLSETSFLRLRCWLISLFIWHLARNTRMHTLPLQYTHCTSNVKTCQQTTIINNRLVLFNQF